MRAADAWWLYRIIRCLLLALFSLAAAPTIPVQAEELAHLAQIRSISGSPWCAPLNPEQLRSGASAVVEAKLRPQEPADVRQLFSEVQAAFEGDELPEGLRLSLSPAPFANAFIRGDAEIVVTMPLLLTVLDRSELAFIFAHELSHVSLGHGKEGTVADEIAADEKALRIVNALGFNPCAGAEVLDRLSSPLSASLASVPPRLKALHTNAPDTCG